MWYPPVDTLAVFLKTVHQHLSVGQSHSVSHRQATQLITDVTFMELPPFFSTWRS